MLALLNQISTPVLIVAAIVIMALNTWFLKWFLGKIQSEPADDDVEEPLLTPTASASSSSLLAAKPTGGSVSASPVVAAEPEPIRTTVGTPRAKPLQPVEPPPVALKTADPAPVRLTSLSTPETVPAGVEAGVANKSAPSSPASAPEPALAAVGASTAPKDSEIRPAISLTKDRGAVSGVPTTASIGALTGAGAAPTPSASLTALPSNKPAEKPASAPSTAGLSPAWENLDKTLNESSKLAPGFSPTGALASGKAPEAATGAALPKLNLTKEPAAPIAAVTGKIAVTPLIPNKGSLETVAPTASLISVDNPAPSLASVTTAPKPNAEVVAPEVKPTPKTEAEEMPKPPAKSTVSEPSPASAGLIAISNKPIAKPEPSPAEKEQLSPARSGLIAIPAKNEAEATPASGGLMLMPNAPAAIDKSAEAFAPPVASPQKTKLMGRPRIFLPANQPAPEPVENKTPVAPAAEVEVPSPAPETTPTPVPSQPDVPTPSAPEAPTPSEPAFPAAPEVESPAEPAPDTTPQAIAEEPAASSFVEEPFAAPAKEGIAPVVETVPVSEAALTHTASPASYGLSKFQPDVSEAEPAPAPGALFAQEESTVAATEPEKTPESLISSVPEPVHAEDKSVHFAEPIAPVAVPSAAPYIQPVPIHTPRRPAMAQNENTTSQAPGGRASAQLTLGFEITSLQLTPFFKLGAVQLRPLSNIVSLHLINAQQADNPLAAGISFQIDTVELDSASHIRSILLRPQPTATPATTPQPKLQVDNVQFSQATEGAPIQITSSQATSTAVQLLATCTIAAMDFTPSFEIGSLRLEPDSNFVMLRLAPSSRPAALDLPPSFEVAAVQLEGESQISTVRLIPGSAPK